MSENKPPEEPAGNGPVPEEQPAPRPTDTPEPRPADTPSQSADGGPTAPNAPADPSAPGGPGSSAEPSAPGDPRSSAEPSAPGGPGSSAGRSAPADDPAAPPPGSSGADGATGAAPTESPVVHREPASAGEPAGNSTASPREQEGARSVESSAGSVDPTALSPAGFSPRELDPVDPAAGSAVPKEQGPGGSGKSGLPGWVVQGLVSVSAIVLALVVGAILIIVGDDQVKTTIGYFGAAPLDTLSAAGTAVGEAYKALVVGALGGLSPITESLTQATPLICGGLAVSLAFRTGLFNIGAQGQLIMGAILAGYVGFGWHLPPVLHLIVALIAGLVGGAIWGGVVGALKARTGAHEVIVTIMLNYVAIYLLQWLLTTKTFQRPGRADPISPVVDTSAQYPQFGDTRLHVGFLLALAAAVGVWWLLNRSTIGFELRAVGANADASRTAGMSVGRAYVVAMLVAGALAGLAGSQQVLGTDLPLTDGVAASIGFDAITVALLGRGTPLGTVLAGLLFGALNAGGLQMQLITQTPLTLTTVLQAVIVLFVAAPALVRSVFRFLPKERGPGAVLAKGWNG